MKLHIETKQAGEVTRSMVVDAIKRQLGAALEKSVKIEVRHFAQKNQFKVFMETNDKLVA